jgi:hypothetical protein
MAQTWETVAQQREVLLACEARIAALEPLRVSSFTVLRPAGHLAKLLGEEPQFSVPSDGARLFS